MLDCLCVGQLVVDHLCDPIDRLPRAGELIVVDALPLSIGGCAANVAVDLAKLGARAGAVGCIGGDVLGDFVLKTLGNAKVDITRVQRLPQMPTAGTLIINVKGEDRRFIHAGGANAAVHAGLISAECLRECRILHVGGYLLLPGLESQSLADLFRKARSLGVAMVLDIVLPGPGDHWKTLEPILAETDVFLPNTDEARAITGLEDPMDQAERLYQAGVGTAVVTCGAAGSVLVAQGMRLRAGIYPMDYRGGTGSGDAFDAGFIVGMLQGEDPAGCLRWGSAVGASCVRSISATESVFIRSEAEAFLHSSALEIESL